MMDEAAILAAFAAAAAEAEAMVGATAPNPPVGCAALDADGRLLAVAAHQRAGTRHAEALVLDRCRNAGLLPAVRCLVVTLEPCNHHGRTPPCTRAIVAAAVSEVWIGARDPNPRVAGGGASALAAAGLRIGWLDRITGPRARELARRCDELIAPFARWASSGRPWVLVKRAVDACGSMIPPPGEKTFTSASSLTLAHVLRKRADAILTGAGTVIADRPLFTVRHVADHPGKRRLLFVLSRQSRVPDAYLADAEARGFEPIVAPGLGDALAIAGRAGILTLLVEAGPRVTGAVLDSDQWDRCVTITAGRGGRSDDVTWRSRPVG